MKKLILLTAFSLFAISINAQSYPVMIKVQGGTFTMGSNSGDESPAHNVTVSSFSMGKYEVTVAEYKAFCKAAGRTMPDPTSWGWNDKHPMVLVSFDDANAYCNWLSEATGKNFRLPTEAEWEYAARGGIKSSGYTYAGSDDLDEAGWSSDNAGGQTQECGRKKANELGLHDMSGNVWEWCKDWYSETYYSSSPATNPKGPTSGSYRVLRGGSWFNAASYCRVASRNRGTPSGGDPDFGFRVVSPE